MDLVSAITSHAIILICKRYVGHNPDGGGWRSPIARAKDRMGSGKNTPKTQNPDNKNTLTPLHPLNYSIPSQRICQDPKLGKTCGKVAGLDKL